MPRNSFLLATILLHLFFGSLAAVADDEQLTYEKHIRPILKAHCFDCHGATDALKGKLDLRLVRFMAKGGESGPAIVPGKPDDSFLIERIESGEMPPGDAKLPKAEIEIFRRWIAAGAATARPEPEKIDAGIGISPEEREFWSFQPIARPDVPQFSKADRVRTPIDALLLAAMKSKGLSFSRDADKRTLTRRAYLDLIGLPPTPKQVNGFVNDGSPHAWENLIDKLLDSPHYGERWGRHWLDVAGYADSEGYTNKDQLRKYAYRYRDYVIRSFNQDKPFDQFLLEQLAGDEMVARPYKNLTTDQIEKLTATGFLRMAADGTGSGANNPVGRNQVMADTIKIVSTSLLGLSVGCAQCHDHRYDPIPQQDYYRFRAIFEPAINWNNWKTPDQRRVSLYTDADRKKSAEIEADAKKTDAEKNKKQAHYIDEALEKELLKYKEPLRGKLRTAYKTPGNKRNNEQKKLLKQNPAVNITGGNLYQYNQKHADEIKAYNKQIGEIRAKKPVEGFLRVLSEVPGNVPTTKIFHRGDHRAPKDAVDPGGLTIAAAIGKRFAAPVNDSNAPTTGRRTAYAKWLTSGKHPLLARVLVNRIWLHHFGRAIVGTPSDFGVLGEKPTHPRLLDWLASEFVVPTISFNREPAATARQDAKTNTSLRPWSLKRFHKLIMLSTAYRQSSITDQQKESLDPANSLYWRKPIQRLDAEVIRDSIILACGKLNTKMFGPPIPIKEDAVGQIVVGIDNKGASNTPGKDISLNGEEFRRSVYITVRRSQPVAFLRTFDAPVMEVNCERRDTSTVAPQALMLMNSDFMLKHARFFAERLRAETPKDFPLPDLGKHNAFQLLKTTWQFGYGNFDGVKGQTANFQPLPHWTGSAWQGGPKRPDPKLGWVIINASGGHTGNDQQHAAIRRWTAPKDGTVTVSGKLHHPSKAGDGVRSRVVSSRAGLLGQWTAQHSDADTSVASFEVRRGDTIDFITDCRGNSSFDSFGWQVDLKLTADDETAVAWNSAKGFHGPIGNHPPIARQIAQAWQFALNRPARADEIAAALEFVQAQFATLASTAGQTDTKLQAMTNLCQALLSSNEFLYVD